MIDDTIPLRLRTVIADVLGIEPDQVTATSGAGETEGWDSFAHLQLMLGLESEFALQLDPNKIADLVTVARIRDELERRGISWR